MRIGAVDFVLLGALLGGVGATGGFVVLAFFADWRRARRVRARRAARESVAL